jgi:hypothetical protein
VISEADDGRGVADLDVAGILSRVEDDAEGVVKAGREVLDLLGFVVGTNAAQDVDEASACVGEEEVAVGRDADEARLGEGSDGARHVLGGLSAL